MVAIPEVARRNVDLGSKQTAAAALRTFFRIAEAWKLSVKEQMAILGVRSRSTLHSWKGGEAGPLGRDTLERLSYVFGIYKALQVIFSRQEQANGWIRKPNAAPIFGGRSALDRLVAGNVSDLYEVRRYLDAQRGGWN
ncbi:MAG TPA: MbcA/ParS/Xre antitoxin family protein [Usitatibacteraceae bacterium]|nr:MbcA/ParS/Xre antitoxin family protein [Usitatibacteraceae bacterium]